MELLIVRHAIAFERDARRWPDDDERPLSPRGLARARQAAAGMRRLVRRPALVLASPLVRARQTAAILTDVAGWPRARETLPLAPGNSPQTLLATLERMPEARIAVVGHEPALSRLLAAALHGSAAARGFGFKKMGAALVTFDGAARARRGRLEWLLPPKALRAAR
ncbi:MAG TPA: histidine phosphatase family protein [Steroidobacteraceae bacterium]|nr:histidine phosphatase family protein [Steroidobacteraceae bacterium]